jgi:PKD repeat protein
VTVSPPPPLSTSFTFLPSTPLVNTPVTFTAVTTSGTSPYTIAWNFGDGTTGTGTIVPHTFTTAQSFTITETATDSSSPAQTATSTQSVTIYTSLPLSATISASTSSPQIGQTVTFTASAIGGTAPYNYAISFGDGTSGTGSSPRHAYSTAGSYTVTLTVTDSALPHATKLATITVNVQAPTPLTLALPRNQTATTGSWINFTVTATSSNPARTVTLSASQLPAGATFDTTTGVFSWKPSVSQTGYYTITFIAADDSTPPMTSARAMGLQVDKAAPAPPGGPGGGSGRSPSGCLLCGTFPAIFSSMWLLLIGGLLGLVTSLALLTIKARASLEHTKRRLNRVSQKN